MGDTRASSILNLWNDDAIPARETIAGALHCAFPLVRNPLAAHAQERSEAWVSKLVGDRPLARKVVRSQFGWFVAGLYPTTGLAELCAAADYASWAFALHEAGSERPAAERPAALGELFERFDAVFGGERLGSRLDVATQALESIVGRLATVLTPQQLEAFAQANRIYFAGLHWQATNRAGAIVPDEEEYTLLRPAANPLRPCFALIEPLERLRLTTGMKCHRGVMALIRLAGRVVSWIDDVLSYEEESRRGEVHNLAVVYEVHRQLRPGAALKAAVRRHNVDAAEFTQYATSLPSFGFSNDIELRRYVKVLESTMRATFEWTLRAAREEAHERKRATSAG
jgi:hypothetical protein